MCGIAGFIDFKNDIQNSTGILNSMCDTLKNRGPDSSGLWCDHQAALSHRRLAVVDIENGKQPMQILEKNATYVITYNGELYNTEDIRAELADYGYSFKGHSDTEVLLTAYICWGEACLQKLNGIYAFAIWNTKTKKLFMARDRIGVKPFFYFLFDSGIVFGSEIKALLQHPNVKPIIDKGGISEIMLLGPGRTPGCGIFKGVKELEAGFCGSFSMDGFESHKYWQLVAKTHTDSFEETTFNVKELVTDAVKRQLVSDVPICTFLSGGLDSSIISAVAAEEMRKKGEILDTYSVDYIDNDIHFKSSNFQPDSDTKWIETMTAFLGTNHTNMKLSNDNLIEALYDATLARDFPGMADVDSSLLLFCNKVKQNSTVAISGECADEIFGGYPWYYKEEVLFHENFPWSTSLDLRHSFLNDGIMTISYAEEYVRERYLNTTKNAPKTFAESPKEARMKEMMGLNFSWFMQTLLDRKDRQSMACGLEVRVPFCDHRIMEYAYNIPWEMKYYREREKGLLREAFTGVLPDDVLWRKKSPYPKTHNPEFLTGVKEIMAGLLESKNEPLFEILSRDKVSGLITSGTQDLNKTWYGQLMSLPQTIAYFIQMNYWLKAYHVDIAL